jgi:hypothetical protein
VRHQVTPFTPLDIFGSEIDLFVWDRAWTGPVFPHFCCLFSPPSFSEITTTHMGPMYYYFDREVLPLNIFFYVSLICSQSYRFYSAYCINVNHVKFKLSSNRATCVSDNRRRLNFTSHNCRCRRRRESPPPPSPPQTKL